MATLYYSGDPGVTILVITDRDPVDVVNEGGTLRWGLAEAPEWDLVLDVGDHEEYVDAYDGHCC